MLIKIDNDLYTIENELLQLLLKDKTSNKNILWATDNYQNKGYSAKKEIVIESKTRKRLIKPRIEKSKKEQQIRSKEKAEVFTPSWICNKQNNLIDQAWFNTDVSPFNTEEDKEWKTNYDKIDFSKYNKDWKDYVNDIRLEITCGEAPYLVSRYDTVTGNKIDVKDRVGLLDRKLRIVSENTDNLEDWFKYCIQAYKSIYGYEFQGDNLLIARENLIFTFLDYYHNKFASYPSDEMILEITDIIIWNIFQMDGLKYVIPFSCKDTYTELVNLFGEVTREGQQCEGCKTNNPHLHNGKYCYIMDWEKNKKIKFISLVRGI